MRQAEIRRLAVAIRDATRAFTTNQRQLAAIALDLVPGLTDQPVGTQPGIGPVCDNEYPYTA